MEKLQVLDELCSSMSCSTVGCKFNVNESTMYIIVINGGRLEEG